MQGALSAYLRVLGSQKGAGAAEGLWQLTGPTMGQICNPHTQHFPLAAAQIHPARPGSKGRRARLEPNST